MGLNIEDLVERLENRELDPCQVIPWGSPVPTFGDLSKSIVATIGINPSNLEFVDSSGKELEGRMRRFHTLKSLNISSWGEAQRHHFTLIEDYCKMYFSRNPYDHWFKQLDYLISDTSISYYNSSDLRACHLDLIPYATSCKWSSLSSFQRKNLLDHTSDILGKLIQTSAVKLVILNGKTVLNEFEKISNVEFNIGEMDKWTLPRKKGSGILGYSYSGYVSEIGGVLLDRTVYVLGFNHNIQSSFGVTNEVKASIKDWLTEKIIDHINV